MTAGFMQGLRESVSPGAFSDIPVYRQRRGGAYGSEEQEQITFFEWAVMLEGRYPALASMYHVPNGGKRGKTEAARLKAAGVRAGVPDICLPFAAGGYIGLYIELKVDKNTASDDQKKWLRQLRVQGHYACICYGWQLAAQVTEAYMLGKLKS